MVADPPVSDSYRVPSPEMEPTLSEGDRVHVRGIDDDEVSRGDIVIVNAPSPDGQGSLPTIKRVVAVAGDEIVATPDGEVLINGEVDDEPYLAPGTVTVSLDRQVVPADHVFVMGDNRPNSSDSRLTGPVPNHDVVALVVST
jgi:signal peptidase I